MNYNFNAKLFQKKTIENERLVLETVGLKYLDDLPKLTTSKTKRPSKTSSTPVVIDSSENSMEIQNDTKEYSQEAVVVHGSHLLLPMELLENPDYFKTIFSMDTWNNVLSEDERVFLRKFLPNCTEEKKIQLIEKLFHRDIFYFGNPVDKLVGMLKCGECYPEVARLREYLNHLKRNADELDIMLVENLGFADYLNSHPPPNHYPSKKKKNK